MAVLAVALSAAVGAAKDEWKKKPASEWTAEEALRILVDSPWARQSAVLSPILLDRRREQQERNEQGPRLAPSWEPGPRHLPAESYLIRWECAWPVVEAFARLRELGMDTSAEFQSPPPLLPANRYVVTVKTTEPPRGRADFVEGTRPGELLRRARLKTKRAEVAPVEVRRSGLGANAAVHFFFPREVDGKPVLASVSEEVEFVLETEIATLRQKFRVERKWLR